MTIHDLHFDCIHFRGDMPCGPNKESGKICDSCSEYQPISKRILIIKLGALGDVIRTTPLLERYRKEFPNCHITWVTNHPEILPKQAIDCIRTFSFSDIFIVTKLHFDIAINLCKDQEAAMLLNECNAKEKCGFVWSEGHLSIANPESEHKLLTGLFDAYSKANTKSYVEEIFEICGFTYQHEPYLLHVDTKELEHWTLLKKMSQGKPIIGLNTGAGARWPTRLWPIEYWKELIQLLQKAGYAPLLLGGDDEHERNLSLKKDTNAMYEGVFPLQSFIPIAAQCDVIVTPVSMTMHIALGLGKRMVLFNNIFNKHEFDLFGKGEIIEPSSGCDCYYGASCSREKTCMKDISVQSVFDAIQRQIP
jgi:heptosyltransferase-2